jgi:hypothetical protein
MYVSDAMLPETEKIESLSIIGSANPMRFDSEGNLISQF